MKKTLSRLLAAALVLAMVCAMIPAAMAAVTGVSISTPTTMTVGGEQTLTATVTKDGGDTATTVTWSVSAKQDSAESTDVISVDDTGKVKALKVGEAYVIATSTAAADKKAVVKITVQAAAALSFTTQPVTAAYVQNATATALSVETTGGYGTTTYQWYSATSADTTVSGTVIDGEVNKTYTPSTAKVGTVYYYCVATSKFNGQTDMTATSNRVAVSVTAAPTQLAFTTQPVTAAYVQNATATALSVETTGGYGTTTYQWYSATSADTTVSGTVIQGEVNKTYTPSTAKVGTTYYYCVATSTDGANPMSATSNRVAVSVTAAKQYRVQFTSKPDSIKAGSAGTLTVQVQESADGTTYTAYKTAVSVSFAVVGGTSYGHLANASVKSNPTTGFASNTLYGDAKGTVVVRATVADPAGGSPLTADVTVSITGSYTADDINYDTDSDGYAYFSEDDFYDAVKAASGKTTLDYVKFTSQYGGKLYKDSDISSSNVVTSSTECVYDHSRIYTREADLDELVFVVNDSKTSHYVEYTAYTSSGTVLATGKVVIDGDASSSGDITYYVSSEETVKLDEDDFKDFFKDEFSNGDLEYVKFTVGDATNYGTSSYGYLYESDAAKASKVSGSTKFYYEAESRQDDLDAVVFTAGTRTNAYTVKIPFTATGEDRYGRTRSVDGTLVIEVNDRTSVTITTDGATFDELKLVKALTPKNVSSSKLDSYYVQFTKVTGGTLYDYYKTATNNEQWSRRDQFYFNAGSDQYDLGDVFFLPKSTVKTAELSYTIYRESGRNAIEVDTGKIVFKVEQAKVTVTFNDIPANVKSWAGDAIEYMAKQGYVGGTGSKTFSPNANMSRAMLVTVLYRMAGEPSVSGIANPFKDVVKGTYYYNAVLWAYNKGIVTGKGADKFAPNDNVSRQEIAAFIYRYAGKPTATGTLTGFSDYAKVSGYATDAMKWATRNEIITGIGGKLVPGAAATRAQVVAMLYRYLNV